MLTAAICCHVHLRCLTISNNVVQVDPSVAEQSAKAKVSEFAFDCAMDSTDPKSSSYVSQEQRVG